MSVSASMCILLICMFMFVFMSLCICCECGYAHAYAHAYVYVYMYAYVSICVCGFCSFHVCVHWLCLALCLCLCSFVCSCVCLCFCSCVSLCFIHVYVCLYVVRVYDVFVFLVASRLIWAFSCLGLCSCCEASSWGLQCLLETRPGSKTEAAYSLGVSQLSASGSGVVCSNS